MYTDYLGRYGQSFTGAAVVEEYGGRLILRHRLWSSSQTLLPIGDDEFSVEDFPERRIKFRCQGAESSACVLSGYGDREMVFGRLGDDESHPLELLDQGRGAEAAEAFAGQADDVTAILDIAATLFASFPSKVDTAVTFYRQLTQRYPDAPEVHTRLGRALVASGEREGGRVAFERAHDLDAGDADALLGLRRLGGKPLRRGWSVPFGLNELLADPTAAEIAQVEADWQGRELGAKDVTVELEEPVSWEHFEGRVTILSHTVLGSKHYGAVFVPNSTDPCPVLLELKGVNPSYFPLDISGGPKSLRFLGRDGGGFVYVIPCLRGETLIWKERRFQSAGDRTNAWDGAADDAIALLSAALQATPVAAAERVSCFGKSRGGGVALLAGQRDQRIKRVLAWSAPTDWFKLMTYGGWLMAETVADTLANEWGPGEGGEAGQFVEWFLKPAIEGGRGLAAVRQHILASSPLYFAHLSGATQLHHGVEDNMVPVDNAQALMARMAELGADQFEAVLHPQAGHDVEYQPDEHITFAKSRAFLLGDS
ncbi:MAG: prolyl oligopeptidase family serine peptidase [Candidatus Latescibacteria bacterium]|nr:prolyl oligopeptidase family serine peptidase [Candidatus Latescibacterota bacterium]